MNAGDVMTTNVVAVRLDTPARSIAQILAKNGISAVPVLDDSGKPVGMVSEGDLMPRNETERQERREWWLRLLAEGEELAPEFLRQVEQTDRTARQVMTSPVVTVEDTADLVEIAALLLTKKIKRVPIMHDGRMVGIVSRANLIKAVAQPDCAPEPEPSLEPATEIVFPYERLAELTRQQQTQREAFPQPPTTEEVSADAFRELVNHFEQNELAHRAEARRNSSKKSEQEVRELMAARLSEDAWQRMLHESRSAAQKGEQEHLILRFPSELCSDLGRAINAPDPNWPATLRGLAAQVYLRWKHELRSRGFHLSARVIDFPNGIPGDIGLYLHWGR
jgi:CBS domain-containing protein